MRHLALPREAFRVIARNLTDFAADYLERLPQLRGSLQGRQNVPLSARTR
jgi:hypothetical protein